MLNAPCKVLPVTDWCTTCVTQLLLTLVVVCELQQQQQPRVGPQLQQRHPQVVLPLLPRLLAAPQLARPPATRHPTPLYRLGAKFSCYAFRIVSDCQLASNVC